jgi:hypothetical protein
MMKWHSFSQIIHYVGGILIIEWMDDGWVSLVLAQLSWYIC